MTTVLSPYPTYKDSDVEWLANIPTHWSVSRLRQAASIIMGQAPNGDSVSINGPGLPFLQGCAEFRFRHPKAKNYCEWPSKIAPSESILLSVRAPVGRMNLADQDYGIGCGLCAIVPVPESAIAAFVQYALHTSEDQFHAVATGSTYDAVSTADVANAVLPLPPLDEQRAIAEFLDGMDARITRFIAARREMIALLEEKKQAVINQAVTRGLDPNVSMKDSGVDWLGEIPAHWDVKRLGSILRERGELNTDGIERRILSVLRVRGVIPYAEKGNIGNKASEDVSRYKVVKKGDLVLNSMNVIIGSLGLSRFDGCLSPVYYVLKPVISTSVNMEFLERVFQLTVFHTTLIRIGNGILAHRMRVSMEKLKAEMLQLPPIEEQNAIVDHIVGEISRVDLLISRCRREIELVQEYRTRLISDVVTGKFDVRGVNLPAMEGIIDAVMESRLDDPVEAFDDEMEKGKPPSALQEG